MNIFLDDERKPEDVTWLTGYKDKDWVIVRNPVDFWNTYINNTDKVELISFDHDIQCFEGDKEITGYYLLIKVIRDCIDNKRFFPKFKLHTQNNIGKANMLAFITNSARIFPELLR